MDPMMTAFLWAMVGAITYRFTATIFNTGRRFLFAKKVVYHCLVLVGAIAEDLAFMRELKYLYMAKSNMTADQIDFAKRVDEQTMNTWKEGAIRIFKSSFPDDLESIVKFNNWREAMIELEKLHKGR